MVHLLSEGNFSSVRILDFKTQLGPAADIQLMSHRQRIDPATSRLQWCGQPIGLRRSLPSAWIRILYLKVVMLADP